MVHVMASIVVRPEQAEAARALLAELAAASRREPGCVSYELFQRPDLPHVFRTIEEWRTAADTAAHMGTPHVAKAIAVGQGMFAAPPEIVTYAKVEAP
jgi:quinol monooxygenase YgiN